MTTNVRKQKIITAIFWSVIAIMLLAMGIYAIRDLPMRLAMKVSPNIHLAIEMSTDNSTYKTVFKNYGNETLDSNINRTIEDGNKITLTGDIFNEIYSNEPLYIRITNYTQASDVEGDANYSSGPALSAYFSAENGVTNYPSYGVQNIAPYDGTNLLSKTFIVIPQSVIVNSSYEFNLKLELSNFVETEYTVTQTLATGITSLNNFATTKAIFGHNFEANFMSTDNSKEIAITSITFGTTSLVEFGDYTFDSDTGKLTIFKDVFENNVGNPLATTNVLTINTALKPANVRVYVYDESQNATILKYGTKTFVDNNSFTIDTKSQFVAQILKTDSVTNLWVSINGEYSDNYFYNQATGLLTISQNALAGDVTINMFSYWTGNVASSFAGGNGSSANPYKICSPSQLAYLAQTTNAGTTYEELNFELKNDLYLNDEQFSGDISTGYVNVVDGVHSGTIQTGLNSTTRGVKTYTGTLHEWLPIGGGVDGNMWVGLKYFKANFNGNSFKIEGIYINNLIGDSIGAGLFGYTYPGYTLRNIRVNNIFINKYQMCGGIVGIGYCGIKNCFVGENSYVIGVRVVGGIVGEFSYGKLVNSFSSGSCLLTDNFAGGSGVGSLSGESASIVNVFSVGDIYYNANKQNMLIGQFINESSNYVNNCYYLGANLYNTISATTPAPNITNCGTITDATTLASNLNSWLAATNATDTTKTNRQYFDIGSGTWQIVAGENDGYPIFV